MASKMENQISGEKSSSVDRDSVKTVETQQMIEPVEDLVTNETFENNNDEKEELREQYDQYNDDPNFNNKQREYYNQRYEQQPVFKLNPIF